MWIFFCFTPKTWKHSFIGCCQSLLQVVTNKTPPLYSFSWCVCVSACSVQLCPNLYGLRDCCLPGSSVLGNFQARMLEGAAISYPRGSFRPKDRTHDSCISCTGSRIFATASPGKPSFSFWRFKTVDSWRHLNPSIRSLFLEVWKSKIKVVERWDSPPLL